MEHYTNFEMDERECGALYRDFGEPLYGLPYAYSCEICGDTNHDASYCGGMGSEHVAMMGIENEWGGQWMGQGFDNQGPSDYGFGYQGHPIQNFGNNLGYEDQTGYGVQGNLSYGHYDQGFGDNQYAPPQQQDQAMQMILDTLNQIQSEMKEQRAYQEMLETRIAQLAEDNRSEFGSGKTYDEPEYEIEDEPMVERECLIDVVDEESSGLGWVNDGPRDPVLEVEHAPLEDEELEVEAISVDYPDHHSDKINVGVIEEGEGKMEESPMPPPEVKFSIKTLPPFPICAYFEETGPKPVAVTLTFSLDPGVPTKGMSPPTHNYYTIFEDGVVLSFGLLENFYPNLWDMEQKKIQEAMVFKEGISTIKGEGKGLCYDLIEGRFDPRPPD